MLANISSDIREDGTLENQLIHASLFNQANFIDTVEDLSNLNYGNYGVLVSDSNSCSYAMRTVVKGSFIDERDDNEYTAVPIGDQVWMGENLAHQAGICRRILNGNIWRNIWE